jgi:hypothetical protein
MYVLEGILVSGNASIYVHVACMPERAIGVVDPAVVGADKCLSVALRFFAHTRTAVATAVDQGMHLIVLVTAHDDGVIGDLEQEVVAFVRNLADVARKEPTLVDDIGKSFHRPGPGSHRGRRQICAWSVLQSILQYRQLFRVFVAESLTSRPARPVRAYMN